MSYKKLINSCWFALLALLLMFECNLYAENIYYDVDFNKLSEKYSWDEWTDNFKKASLSVRKFNVRSVEEFAKINIYYDAFINDGEVVHEFTLENGDLIHCIDIYTQKSFTKSGQNKSALQLSPGKIPEIIEDDIAYENGKESPSFGLDGSLDNENNIRQCPNKTFPKIIPPVENFYSFKTFEAIFKKTPINFEDSNFEDSNKDIKISEDGEKDSTTHEYAVVYGQQENAGLIGDFNLWSPHVAVNDHFSLSQLWVARGDDSNTQTVETGWQNYPAFYGSNESRLFIFYTPDNYSSGCYNLHCSTFVQTDSSIPIQGAWDSYSEVDGVQHEITLAFIRDDQNDHHWWLRYGKGENAKWLGYYPNSTFHSAGIGEKNEVINFGGEITVQNVASSETHMGSGRYSNEGETKAAYIKNIRFVDMDNVERDALGLITHTTFSDFWTISNVNYSNDENWKTNFFFGGPGYGTCQCSSGKCCDGCLYLASEYKCREAVGACDDAEFCLGSSAECPEDLMKPSEHKCREAIGVCDEDEFCLGSNAECPEDLMKPSDYICRESIGVCDEDEFCLGTSGSCPEDVMRQSDYICRESLGACDAAEYCSGIFSICPVDNIKETGETCDDGNIDTVSDQCTSSGNCVGIPAETDGDVDSDIDIDTDGDIDGDIKENLKSSGCQTGNTPSSGLKLLLLGFLLVLTFTRKRFKTK